MPHLVDFVLFQPLALYVPAVAAVAHCQKPLAETMLICVCYYPNTLAIFIKIAMLKAGQKL